MSHEMKETPLELVVPDFDLVVVAARDKERLRLMEADAADGAVVLVKLVEERAHAVIPQLDHTVVKAERERRNSRCKERRISDTNPRTISYTICKKAR
jgi:hypothetical protein